MQIPEANLKAVDCKQVQNGVEIAGAICFLSSLVPEKLLEQVKKAIEPLASTPGWSEDYMVWHAFYAYRSAPKISFGINVGDPHNSATYQRGDEHRDIKSFIAFVVDTEPK